MLRRGLRTVASFRQPLLRQPTRKFGGGGHGEHHEPHIPEFHDKLGKFCATLAFFWIMIRAKENKGALFVSFIHSHRFTIL